MSGKDTPVRSVAIVGGGWSGIYALKYCLEQNLARSQHSKFSLRPVLFESAPHAMGVWRSLAEPQKVIASSSKTYLHPSDFPFPEETPVFPTAAQINAHMTKYCKHFQLERHMRFGCRVIRAEWESSSNIIKKGKASGKASGRWRLEIQSTSDQPVEIVYFDKLILGEGGNGIPYRPEKLVKRFKIPSIHHADFLPSWEQLPATFQEIRHRPGHILVVGGGESATEVCSYLVEMQKTGSKLCNSNACNSKASSVILSLRSGRWFLPKWKYPGVPADVVSRKTFEMFRFPRIMNIFDEWVRRNSEVAESRFYRGGVGNHGIACWDPKQVASWSCFLNKTAEKTLQHIETGEVIPAGDVLIPDEEEHKDRNNIQRIDLHDSLGQKKTEGSKDGVWVRFRGVSEPKLVKAIVYCTGYRRITGLQSSAGLQGPEKAYRYVWPIPEKSEEPSENSPPLGSVAYIGAVRPNVGSIPALAEVNAMWIARVFGGEERYENTFGEESSQSEKSLNCLRKAVEEDRQLCMRSFPEDGKKIPTLVHMVDYADKVLREMGVEYLSLSSGGSVSTARSAFAKTRLLWHDRTFFDSSIHAILFSNLAFVYGIFSSWVLGQRRSANDVYPLFPPVAVARHYGIRSWFKIFSAGWSPLQYKLFLEAQEGHRDDKVFKAILLDQDKRKSREKIYRAETQTGSLFRFAVEYVSRKAMSSILPVTKIVERKEANEKRLSDALAAQQAAQKMENLQEKLRLDAAKLKGGNRDDTGKTMTLMEEELELDKLSLEAT